MARPPSLQERLREKYFQLLSSLKNYRHFKHGSALITYSEGKIKIKAINYRLRVFDCSFSSMEQFNKEIKENF